MSRRNRYLYYSTSVIVLLSILLSGKVNAVEGVSNYTQESLTLTLDEECYSSLYAKAFGRQEAPLTVQPQIINNKLYVSLDTFSYIFNTCPCNTHFDVYNKVGAFYMQDIYVLLEADSFEVTVIFEGNLFTSSIEVTPLVVDGNFMIPITEVLNLELFASRFSYNWQNEIKVLAINYDCPKEFTKRLELGWYEKIKDNLNTKEI